MPELDLVKGPLSDDTLGEVARLYGKTDGKYSDIEHCRLLFNQSPFGPTFHAFAKENGRAVGHYCLIPYDLQIGDREVRAAKGEALHILSDYRRSECSGVPTSDALLHGAQELAEREGVMVSYAVVGAPGVIRLFERCGYRHNPFSVHDLIVPQTKALPLGKVLKSKAKNWSAQLNIAESLVEVDFQAVETRLPLELDGFEEAWRPVLSSDTLRWFGKAPSNRFFQLGEGVVWLTQTHQDWEVLCSFTQKCTVAQRTCLAHELRKEATRRGIDVIRIPDVLGVEVEMRRAFEVLARRVTSREVSFVVKSVESIGRASPLGFLWAHF